MDDLVDLAATTLLDAWTVIGSFVVLSLLVTRLVRTALDGQTLDSLLDRRGVGPLAGAVLGAVPGCGGAIAVVSLYGRGAVGFGPLLASLIATAGDSAFVLASVAPRTAVVTYAIAFLTGVAVGVAVDEYDSAVGRVESPGSPVDGRRGDAGRDAVHATDEGARHVTRGGLAVRTLRTAALVGWWTAATVGLAVGLCRAVGGDVPRLLATGQPVGAVTAVSALGVGLSVGIAFLPERILYAPGREGLRAVAVDTTVESAPLVAWIFAALAGSRLLFGAVDVGALSGVTLGGWTGAVVGGVLGAVPGCGVHVGFVTACADGGLPLPALVANAISQDGDALFALFAVDRTTAVVATVYTAVSAVAVGAVVASV